jgi:hypothetical protein
VAQQTFSVRMTFFSGYEVPSGITLGKHCDVFTIQRLLGMDLNMEARA